MITPPDSRRHRLTPALGVGTVTVCAALTVFAGPLGTAGGIAIALVTVGLGPVAGVAVGHLVAVPLLGSPSTVDLILFELSIIPLLAAPLIQRPSVRSALVAGGTCLALVACSIVAWGAVDNGWLLAGGLVSVLAGAGYVIHRYELVMLGLVTDEATPPQVTNES